MADELASQSNPPFARPNASRWRITPAMLAFATLIVAGTCAVGPRARVRGELPFDTSGVPDNMHDLPAWVASQEARFDDLIEGTEKRITWFDGIEQTTYAVVYLHGYSASRQETAPFCEELARRLEANLFETRLTGHGRSSPDAMLDGTPEAWARDAAEALAVGHRLGDNVVVVGVSTGATLALWLATRAEAHELGLHSLVLVSPNLGVADPTLAVLSLPWAPILLPTVMPRRAWEPANEAQDEFWTHDYPTSALFPMDALVRHVIHLPLDEIDVPALVFSNPQDSVVDADAAREALSGLANLEWEDIDVLEDEDPHVLVGQIFAPGRVAPMAEQAAAFVRRPAETD